MAVGTVEAQPNTPSNVLVLHSYDPQYPWTRVVMQGIQTVFDKEDLLVNLSVEYMDTKRHSSEAYYQCLKELYQMKYHNKKFDVIIVSDNNALDFLLSHRDELFSGTPIVFCGINSPQKYRDDGYEQITGVAEDPDMNVVVQTIRRLHPQCKRIAYVHIGHQFGRAFARELKATVSESDDDLELIGLFGTEQLPEKKSDHDSPATDVDEGFFRAFHLSPSLLRKKIRQLPPDTVLLVLSPYLTWNAMWNPVSVGPKEIFQEAESIFSAADKRGLPIYALFDHYLAHSALGVVEVKGSSHGEKAGRMAVAILRGQPVEKIPILQKSPCTLKFSRSRMQRFGISKLDLPTGAVVIDDLKVDSFYKQFQRQIWIASGVFLALSAIVVILVINIHNRKQAEKWLYGERRVLELIASGAPLQELLTALIEFLESLANGMSCSVLLLDEEGRLLRLGAAPSLPEEYNRAIEGTEIGPEVGSCGTAAYLDQPVIVEDIATDPLWANFRELALQHGLRACWSTPIHSASGKILGTFAMYYRAPRGPGAKHQQLIDRAVYLAAIAIEYRLAEISLNALQAAASEVTGEEFFERAIEILMRSSGMSSAHIGESLKGDDTKIQTIARYVDNQPANNIVFDLPESPCGMLVGKTIQVYRGKLWKQFPESEFLRTRRIRSYLGVQLFSQAGKPIGVLCAMSEKECPDGFDSKTLLTFLAVRCGAELERRQSLEKLQHQQSALAHASRVAVVGELSSGVIHEISQPLFAISNFSGACRRTLEDVECEGLGEVGGYLDRITQATKTAQEIVIQYRGYLERQDVQQSVVVLHTVIEGALKLLAFEIRNHRVTVDCDLVPNTTVFANPVQLQQVFVNLILNACEALNAVPAETRHILIRTSRVESKVEIAIEDNGTGISKEVAEHLFKPFFTTKAKGLGMGMTITKGIISQHSGKIWFTASPGQGATFHVALPVFKDQ